MKYAIFSMFVVSAFLTYRAVRTALVNEALGQAKNEQNVVVKVLSQGSGLQGISAILRRYGKDVDYLYGKTYFDMFLLPIPRVIYTSKPSWYGVDDISTGMGWPKSTQSAVTMPGEAYANFGWFGLIVPIILGTILGLILKLIFTKAGLFFVIYPSIIIPCLFVSNWISFTGLMNMFFPTIFTFCLLFLLKTKFRIGKNNN